MKKKVFESDLVQVAMGNDISHPNVSQEKEKKKELSSVNDGSEKVNGFFLKRMEMQNKSN